MFKKKLALTLMLTTFLGNAFSETKPLELDDISSVRMLGHNNLPIKVMVALQNGNKDYVTQVAELIGQINNESEYIKRQQIQLMTVGLYQPDIELTEMSIPYRQVVEVRADRWLQDFGEIMMVKTEQDSKEQLLLLDSNRGRGLADFASFLSDLWNAYYYKSVDPGYEYSNGITGNYGGNIEVTPNNVLYIGDTSSKKMRKFFTENGYKENHAVLETNWLQVGHIDEYTSTIVYPEDMADPTGCGFAIVKSDPNLAVKLITRAKMKKGKALGLNKFFPFMPSFNKNNDLIGIPEKYKHTSMARKLENIVKTLNNDKYLLDSNKDKANRMLAHNRSVSKIIDKNVEKLIAVIAKKSPNCTSPKVISFPTLFDCGNASENVRGSRACAALLPGSANMLVLRNNLIIPDPFFRPFKRYQARVLKAYGQRPYYLDDMYYHENLGEIHCGSNVFRLPNENFSTRVVK